MGARTVTAYVVVVSGDGYVLLGANPGPGVAYAWPSNGGTDVAKSVAPQRPVYDSGGQLNVVAMKPAPVALFTSRNAAELAANTALSASHSYEVRPATPAEQARGSNVEVYQFDERNHADVVP